MKKKRPDVSAVMPILRPVWSSDSEFKSLEQRRSKREQKRRWRMHYNLTMEYDAYYHTKWGARLDAWIQIYFTPSGGTAKLYRNR